jgi:hypothetical protein
MRRRRLDGRARQFAGDSSDAGDAATVSGTDNEADSEGDEDVLFIHGRKGEKQRFVKTLFVFAFPLRAANHETAIMTSNGKSDMKRQ